MPLLPRSPRALSRLWLALGLSVGMLLTSAAPGFTTDGKLPTHETLDSSEEPAPIELTLAPTETVLDPAAQRYEFTTLLTNQASEEIVGGSLSLELSPQRIEKIAQLSEPFPDAGTHISEIEVGAISPDAPQSATISVQRTDFPLSGSDAPGVYLLRATFIPQAGDEPETDSTVFGTTPIVWRGAFEPASTPADPSPTNTQDQPVGPAEADATNVEASPTTELGLIIPLVLPAQVNAMPSRKQIDEVVPRLAALIDTAEKTRATLAIDPRIIASIRASGEDASQQAQQLLTRLESTQLPNFLLQFADADPAAQAALGYSELLAPKNLDYVTRQASQTPAADDSENSLPTLESLLEWQTDQPTVGWPADGQADGATIELLRSGGFSDVVLSSDNVTHSGGPRATFTGETAFVSDTALTELTRDAITADDDTNRMSALSEAVARLALTAQNDGHGTLIALDRGAIAEAENPSEIITQLTSLSWVTPTAVPDLQAGSASLRSAAPLEERRELLRAAANQEPDVDALSVLLRDPSDLTGYQRARLLVLFGTRYAADGTNFAAVAEQFTARDTELRRGVQAISTEHTQLVGTSTRVPLQLHNHLPFEAIVTVNVAPSSAAIQVSDQQFLDVSVAADGNSRVFVPVHSRVSSGETALEISISDASGETVTGSSSLPLTIRSSIETIGLWTLGILTLLLLVFGTRRSLRKRRERAEEAKNDLSAVDPSSHNEQSSASE